MMQLQAMGIRSSEAVVAASGSQDMYIRGDIQIGNVKEGELPAALAEDSFGRGSKNGGHAPALDQETQEVICLIQEATQLL